MGKLIKDKKCKLSHNLIMHLRTTGDNVKQTSV